MSLAPIAFDFGAPASCTRAFTHAGRDYEAGAAFPYGEFGLARHEVHGLWLAHLIRFDVAPAETPVSPKPSKPKRRAQPTAQ